MIKTQAISRLKSTSATDAKGAAEAIQKIIDKSKLNLKAAPRTSQSGGSTWIVVKGKTAYGPVELSFDLDKGKGLTIDYYDIEGVDLDQALEKMSNSNTLPDFTGTKAADVKRLAKHVESMKKAKAELDECTGTIVDFWIRWQKVVAQISQIAADNK